MKNKIVLAFVMVLITGSIAYYLGNKGNKDQNKLVKEIKELSSQRIISIDILEKDTSVQIADINDPSVIKTVKKHLANVDKTEVGGHNIPTNESIFIFKMGDGSVVRLYAACYSAYEYNKNAVYFLEPITKNKVANKPARVPGLKSVIFDN